MIRYLESHPAVQEMVDDIAAYLQKWLPRHAEEHRSYLTVGIGCTGGQHRSVYFVEALAKSFRESTQVLTRHRGLSS